MPEATQDSVDLKSAVALLRAVETEDSQAADAVKSAQQKAADLRLQLDQADKDTAAAKDSKTATAKKVADARLAVAAKMRPGVAYTEAGSTVLILDNERKLHEIRLNRLAES
jgi:hypothetical protein